eukprot:440906-Pelagomonas_calceolata.AAC.1
MGTYFHDVVELPPEGCDRKGVSMKYCVIIYEEYLDVGGEVFYGKKKEKQNFVGRGNPPPPQNYKTENANGGEGESGRPGAWRPTLQVLISSVSGFLLG